MSIDLLIFSAIGYRHLILFHFLTHQISYTLSLPLAFSFSTIYASKITNLKLKNDLMNGLWIELFSGDG
jgi:hypothetical protein